MPDSDNLYDRPRQKAQNPISQGLLILGFMMVVLTGVVAVLVTVNAPAEIAKTIDALRF
jgi:hypothetical protein